MGLEWFPWGKCSDDVSLLSNMWAQETPHALTSWVESGWVARKDWIWVLAGRALVTCINLGPTQVIAEGSTGPAGGIRSLNLT